MRIVYDKRFIRHPKHLRIRVYDTEDKNTADISNSESSFPIQQLSSLSLKGLFFEEQPNLEPYSVLSEKTLSDPIRSFTYHAVKFLYSLLDNMMHKESMYRYPAYHQALKVAAFVNDKDKQSDSNNLNHDGFFSELLRSTFFGERRRGPLQPLGDRIRSDVLRTITKQLMINEFFRMASKKFERSGHESLARVFEFLPFAWWAAANAYSKLPDYEAAKDIDLFLR